MHLTERQSHCTEATLQRYMLHQTVMQLQSLERTTGKIFKTKQGKLKLVTPTFYGFIVPICEKLWPIRNKNG